MKLVDFDRSGWEIDLLVEVNLWGSSGAWLLSGKFEAMRPKGRRFESDSSSHVGTLGKYFICSCL